MTDDDELDALLNDDPAPEPEGPKGNSTKSNALLIQALRQPVSITFLAEVFRRDRKTVTKKLAGLTPISHHRGSTPLYDFVQAAECLVTPRVNLTEYVRNMGVGDLPVALQKDVWDARLKEQKWRTEAGELWRTDQVLEVLGEAFVRLKTTTQLWVDQISEGHALPAEARADLMALVDGLQTDLHRTLVEMPKLKKTKPQLAEIEGTELDG